MHHNRFDGGWDAVYNPVTGRGQVQHTTGGGEPLKFTLKSDRSVTMAAGTEIPTEILRSLRRWVRSLP